MQSAPALRPTRARRGRRSEHPGTGVPASRAGGSGVGAGRQRQRRPRSREIEEVRSRHPRPDAARPRRRHRVQGDSARFAERGHADSDAHRAARRVRQGRRPRQRRRRLPDEAVRRARADGARPRADSARAARHARRATAAGPSPTSTSRSIPSRRAVKVGDRDVELTTNEFQLLYVLLSNPGIVFSREALLRKVWKDDTFVTVRSVDTLVKRVRKKIEDDPAEPSVILTVWGAGYKAADV